jgi:hypothetical protein
LRRREFITLLGGAAVQWPVVAWAQQRPGLPTVGLLGSTTPSAEAQRVAGFVQRLRELGWTEGQNIAIEYWWAEGRKSGSAPGYNYSPALKSAGITWDEQELDKYLTNPPADIHGTKMVISVPNAEDRQNVIAYLKTLK